MEKPVRLPARYRRAEIPPGNAVPGEILGIDDDSYVYIAFCDAKILEDYQVLLKKMEDCVRDRYCMPSRLSKKPGMECILEYAGRRGGIYVRGQVVEPLPETNAVRCKVLDDFLVVDLHHTQIFHSTPSIADFPKFSMKCKLDGMDCFCSYPLLNAFYKHYMKGQWKPHSNHCTVEVLDRESPVPTVRLTTIYGKDLTDILQQYIPTFQLLEYPNFGVPIRVKVTHCDDKGHVWFQPWQNKTLMDVITTRLVEYSDGYLTMKRYQNSEPRNANAPSWKENYINGPGEVYLYRRLHNQRHYRVQKLSKSSKESFIEVFFMDYGEIETLPEDALIPAKLIDQNLCFIQSQCLPVKFIGAGCSGDDIKEFNLRQFWKYVVQKPVHIVLKALYITDTYQCMDENLLTQLVDYNQNSYFPVKNEGRFPEADLYVSTKGKLTKEHKLGRSLYEIYHTLEICLVHDSIPQWDSWKEVPANGDRIESVNLSKDEKIKLDMNLKFSGTEVERGETKEIIYSWMDYITDILRDSENPTDYSSRLKPYIKFNMFDIYKDENNNFKSPRRDLAVTRMMNT